MRQYQHELQEDYCVKTKPIPRDIFPPQQLNNCKGPKNNANTKDVKIVFFFMILPINTITIICAVLENIYG